jgi:hypothetical protein
MSRANADTAESYKQLQHRRRRLRDCGLAHDAIAALSQLLPWTQLSLMAHMSPLFLLFCYR